MPKRSSFYEILQHERSRVEDPWEFRDKPAGSGGDHKSLKVKDVKNLTQEQLENLSYYQYN